jgi:geranylgeranyl reductase family protein
MIYDADVIVVGAGPGGSTAAAIAAQCGLKTLMLDREQFPRDKACGDAVPISCFKVLRELGLGPFTSDDYYAIDKLHLRGPRGTSLTFQLSHDDDLGSRIVSRYVFDQMLFEFAQNCGAEVQTVSVSGPLIEDGQVIGIRGKRDKQNLEFRAKVVIGADGATSAIARALGSYDERDDKWAVALRGYVETVSDLNGTIEFAFLDKIQPGYAWLFPVGRRLANVGVGMRSDFYKKQNKTLPEALDYYCSTPAIRKLIGMNKARNLKSWPIPLFSFDRKRVFDGAMLIGDAAGFVNPITGAGIYTAVVTGQYAAKTAAHAIQSGDVTVAGLDLYNKMWQDKLGADLKRAVTLHNILAAIPNLIDGLLLTGKMIPNIIPRLLGKI